MVNLIFNSILVVVCSSFLLKADDGHDNKSDGYAYDLTMLGQVKWGGSVDRHPITLATLFKNDLRMNHIRTPGHYDFTDVEPEIVAIIDNPDKSAGRVSFVMNGFDDARIVPEQSFINICYALIESTVLPKHWVSFINERFDMAVVADEYYRAVYENSGVTKPVFVQPHGIYVEDLLQEEMRSTPSTPFVFGCSAFFHDRKNQELLARAFIKEFNNNPDVKLILHGRPLGLGTEYIDKVRKIVKDAECTNIEIINTGLTKQEYKKMFNSFDCYVILSKGEGFSITPRESLALGKPAIISNNTAQKTIADTGFVYAVPSTIECPIPPRGHDFNCDIEDVCKALREVRNNYQTYIEKAQKGREWVKEYLWKNLKPRFMNLFKPKKVILGNENKITDDYIMTTSPELYEKYTLLIENKVPPVTYKTNADGSPVLFDAGVQRPS